MIRIPSFWNSGLAISGAIFVFSYWSAVARVPLCASSSKFGVTKP